MTGRQKTASQTPTIAQQGEQQRRESYAANTKSSTNKQTKAATNNASTAGNNGSRGNALTVGKASSSGSGLAKDNSKKQAEHGKEAQQQDEDNNTDEDMNSIAFNHNEGSAARAATNEDMSQVDPEIRASLDAQPSFQTPLVHDQEKYKSLFDNLVKLTPRGIATMEQIMRANQFWQNGLVGSGATNTQQLHNEQPKSARRKKASKSNKVDEQPTTAGTPSAPKKRKQNSPQGAAPGTSQPGPGELRLEAMHASRQVCKPLDAAASSSLKEHESLDAATGASRLVQQQPNTATTTTCNQQTTTAEDDDDTTQNQWQEAGKSSKGRQSKAQTANRPQRPSRPLFVTTLEGETITKFAQTIGKEETQSARRKLMLEIQKHKENVHVIDAYFTIANHLVLKTDNKEDNERLKTWPEGAFGGNDVRAHVRNEFIAAVKGVGKAITISEEEAEVLKNRYGVLSIKRVKDRRGEDSTVLRVELDSEEHYKHVIENGLHIDYLHRRAQPWVRAVITCYKCKRIGHIAINCKGVLRCARCAGEHSSLECKVSKDEFKCINCNGKHKSCDHKHCPSIKTTFEHINKPRWSEIAQIRPSYSKAVKQNAPADSNQPMQVATEKVQANQSQLVGALSSLAFDLLAALSTCPDLIEPIKSKHKTLLSALAHLNRNTIKPCQEQQRQQTQQQTQQQTAQHQAQQSPRQQRYEQLNGQHTQQHDRTTTQAHNTDHNNIIERLLAQMDRMESKIDRQEQQIAELREAQWSSSKRDARREENDDDEMEAAIANDDNSITEYSNNNYNNNNYNNNNYNNNNGNNNNNTASASHYIPNNSSSEGATAAASTGI